MQSPNDIVIVVVGAVAATLLQVLIVPHIAVAGAIPNVMAAFCLVAALVRPGVFKYGLPFAMGLLYDLVSGGPVGAMAFSLTVAATFCDWFYQRTSNDTMFMALVTLALSLLVMEAVYGIFFLMFGYALNLIEAFAYRVLPCTVYDAAVAAVVYLAAVRFLGGGSAPIRSEITQL